MAETTLSEKELQMLLVCKNHLILPFITRIVLMGYILRNKALTGVAAISKKILIYRRNSIAPITLEI